MPSFPVFTTVGAGSYAAFRSRRAQPARSAPALALGALRERPFLIDTAYLVLLGAGVYLLPLTFLTIRGEESRWAHVATEMLRTADWIVPREQGQPLLSRPPLACWLIAAASWCRGACDLPAVRLPGVLAVLLTALVLYGYARTFLARPGALAAGMAFLTMAQVLELGRLAETEAVFTGLLGSALLVWHWSWLRGWSGGWVAGYTLAALAALTKGPQAPIYFVGALVVYLLVTGNARRLFCWGHLWGALTFAVLVAGWQVPYGLVQGWGACWQIWAGDTALRFLAPPTRAEILQHLVCFPGEVLACTLPWSPLLFLYADPRMRARLGAARPAVIFLTVCLAVSFPTCWLTPTAKTRYFMPLYPCLAALAGIAVQRCLDGGRPDWLSRGWRGFLLLTAVVMAAVGIALLGGGLVDGTPLRRLCPPGGRAILFGCQVLILAYMAGRSALESNPSRSLGGVVAVAAFTGLASSTLVLNEQLQKSMDARPAMARLVQILPPDEPLFSFGPLHSLFLYYFPRPIEELPLPQTAADLDGRVTCFAFVNWGLERPHFPFPWELIARVNCDRYRETTPLCQVFVGRRLPASAGPPGAPLRDLAE